ncbi:MAG: hypothetical protein M3007_07015 [Candidatus Eremiobacteraeota bacterium]|nr:hypothetical protein [Candidatus Eremiobacteraeota bacterium]
MAHPLDTGPFAIRLIAGITTAAIFWVVAFDYGSLLISRWLPDARPLQRLSLAGAAGYAMWGIAFALLSLAHLLGLVTAWLVLIMAAALGAGRHWRRLRALRSQWFTWRARIAALDSLSRASLVVALFALITAILAAAMPATWWDPIAYHLPIASAALHDGFFHFDPQMIQSGFPLLGESAALATYAIAGASAAALTTLGAGVVLGLLVWSTAEAIAPDSGPLAFVLLVSSALWLWLAPSFYVDVPFAMLVVAAFVSLASMEHVGAPLPAAALGGMFMGSAASVKYSGLLALIVGFALLLRYSPRPRRLSALLVFLGGAAAIATGWYVRGLIVAADPLYPFLSTITSSSLAQREFAQRYVDMTKHWCGAGTSLNDLVTLPYRMLFEPRHFCGDPGYALQAAIVFFIAAAIAVRASRTFIFATLMLTVLWFFTSQQWRFAIPAVALYVAIAAAGVGVSGPRLRPIFGFALVFLCGWGVLVNWIPATQSQASSSLAPGFAHILGKQTADDYLAARLESYSAARWLAQKRIAGNTIAALDDVRDYYFPRGTTWINPYYQQVWSLDWKLSASARYHPLRAHGLVYLVANEHPAYLHRTPTGVDWGVFQTDTQHGLHPVFSQHEVSIYDLRGLP